MTATRQFIFADVYRLRPAGSVIADALLAEEWTATDQWHAGLIDPAFWLEQAPDKDSFILEDFAGPIFFFKTHLLQKTQSNIQLWMAVQLFIQFMPIASSDDLKRVADGLLEGLKWLEETLKSASVSEIFFDSYNPTLIRFCTKRLGFTLDGTRLRKQLIP